MMFSDDLYNHFVEHYPKNDEEAIKVISKGISMCCTRISEENDQSTNLDKLIVIIENTCNIWKLVANQLEKAGNPLIKPGGLRDFILSKDEFKEIHKLI